MNRWLQSNDVISHTSQLTHHHIYQDETIVSLLATAATSASLTDTVVSEQWVTPIHTQVRTLAFIYKCWTWWRNQQCSSVFQSYWHQYYIIFLWDLLMMKRESMMRYYRDPENGLHPQTVGDIPPSSHMKPHSSWLLSSPDLPIHLSGCQSGTSYLWDNQRNQEAQAEHHLPDKKTSNELNCDNCLTCVSAEDFVCVQSNKIHIWLNDN